MRHGNSNWRRYFGILLLSSVSLGGIALTNPGRRVLVSTQSFVRYFRALENSGVPGGFWERVAFSLVLTTTDASASPSSKPGAMSSS
jgi:hypothetical protein